MKLERLSSDKIRVFLTFDDLRERGIKKEDMWNDIPKVHELFNEMMNHAYEELGFEVSGPVAVEIFALPAQGMVVIVTKSRMEPGKSYDEDDDEELDGLFEMQVTLEQSDTVCYVFRQFEDVIGAAKILKAMNVFQGALFFYKERYVLHMEPDEMEDKPLQDVVSVLAEYGEPTSYTKAVMEEYGQVIIAADAVSVLCTHFS